ncbi:MAG: ATP-binding protein [Synergistaceae bacterium]|nr:ATP-binding protein [Synergistaceae bacterium]
MNEDQNQIEMLKAMNRVGAILLNSDIESFENALHQGMKIIAEAVKVNCVYIWKNRVVDGQLFCYQLMEWSEQSTVFADGSLYSYSEVVPGWEKKLSEGNCINNLVRNLSQEEQDHLSPSGILSIMVAPIFVKDQFWGFVGFDDCHRERVFSEEEESILRSGGLLFVDALLRNEMVASIRDTSVQLKAALEKVREDEERMQLMLDAMPLTCHLINRDYEIIDCNQEALNLFGVACKEEYGEKYKDFLPPYQPCGGLSLELNDVYIDKAIEEGHFRFEWLYQNLGGELLPCEITLVRVRYKGEDIIAEFARDLREQKAVAEETRRAEIAEESNKAKSSFLAVMSHEIRTPMNAILGITEIQLHNEKLAPNTREALGKIYNSGELLLGIINDILDLSKIEAGRLELAPAEYDVASLLNDTTTLNVMRVGSKPIEFILSVDENTPSVLFGDELRIKQILNNLLSNAFKYTERGLVKLSISAEGSDERGEATLVIKVSDTGHGMTEEQINVVFDAYTRFNVEANRMTEGAGLGMNITYNLVRLMDGEITVKSEPGIGTIVIVRLPQKTADAGVLGRETAEKLQKFTINGAKRIRRAQVLFEPMPYGRVLVVDDVESNLYVVKGLLAPYELSVDAVMSGFDAIAKIKGGKTYDVVFMDHMMPQMDGMEATNIIRDLGYTQPIVALTANALAGQAEIFLTSGFDGFISKPIDIRQLNAVLKKFIRDKQPPEVIEAAYRQSGQSSKISTLEHAVDEPAVSPQLAQIFIRDADKAVTALEAINTNAEKRGVLEEEDIRMYTINVHSMKSALANIDETELSVVAGKLEQAGRNKDIAMMLSETQAFLGELRAIVEKLAQMKEEGKAGKTEEADYPYLREKLFAVKEACEIYDKKTAKAILAELEQKTWPRPIKELLDTMAGHLLNGDFEEVSRAAESIEDTKG